MLQSYTDRPKRTPNEKGHTFISNLEFSLIKEKDMLAYTKFGDYNYCCLHSDLTDVNVYVIDEVGLEYLKKNFSDRYIIYSIYLTRSEDKRIESGVSFERMRRDSGMFIKRRQSLYDVKISNDNSIGLLFYNIDVFLKKIGIINHTESIIYYSKYDKKGVNK